MSNSNKIKSLSKKLAASLIKNETSGDLERSEIFDVKTREKILKDVKEGNRLELLKRIDTETGWKALKREIEQRFGKLVRFWSYGIAASMVVLISITFIFNKINEDQDFDSQEPIIVNNNIEIGTDKATLTLEDGSEVALEKGMAYQSAHLTSNGEEIVYDKATSKGIIYNTLTIPRGGQFYIALSDGTKVWLNSESQLKYPVAFNEGVTRQIELVYGEAYFDVSPSRDHKGAKFRVFHQSQEVEVLGTEFNIKAYKDEAYIYTTLVEGKVAVRMSGASRTLVPDQQLYLNIETNSIAVSKVDVYNEISWKDGVFSFKNMSLKDIMKVLSRWYDMEVTIENDVQKEEKFIGAFNKGNSIEDILMAIKGTNFINDYEIHDKRLIVK